MNQVRNWLAVWLALGLAVAAWAYTASGAFSSRRHPFASPIDGRYAKIETELMPQWWLCKRCADFRPAGGIWRLQLMGGQLRLEYEATGWRSQSRFAVSNQELLLSEDVHCPNVIGRYRWSSQNGQLVLTPIEDDCAFGLRAETLTRMAWDYCSAGTTDARAGPSALGCFDPEPPQAPADSNRISHVHGGDSRFFERPPEVFIAANVIDSPAPIGYHLTHHPDSLGYGLSRVLWWGGNWVEVASDVAYASWGVQFHGDPAIGWARVLLDGEEVWRGDTAAIWSEFGRHATYVELLGLVPGEHYLRVESLDFDFRAVTVAGFGFSAGPVQP